MDPWVHKYFYTSHWISCLVFPLAQAYMIQKAWFGKKQISTYGCRWKFLYAPDGSTLIFSNGYCQCNSKSRKKLIITDPSFQKVKQLIKFTSNSMSVILTFLLNQPLFFRDPLKHCWHIRAPLNCVITINSIQYSKFIYLILSFINTYLPSVIHPPSSPPTPFYIFLLLKRMTSTVLKPLEYVTWSDWAWKHDPYTFNNSTS